MDKNLAMFPRVFALPVAVVGNYSGILVKQQSLLPTNRTIESHRQHAHVMHIAHLHHLSEQMEIPNVKIIINMNESKFS